MAEGPELPEPFEWLRLLPYVRRIAMGIAEWIERRNAEAKERLRQEGRQTGWHEGRQERQATWSKWRRYHLDNGRQFDNPPVLDETELPPPSESSD